MVIYLEQYTAAKTTLAAWLKDDTSAGEIMDANGNRALLRMARVAMQTAPTLDLPDELSTVDRAAFLGRVRALATLI